METGRDPLPNIRRSWGSCERLGVRIKGAGGGGVKDTTRKLTESTLLGPYRLIQTKTPIKEHIGAGSRAQAYL